MLYYYSARSADGGFVRGSLRAAGTPEALSALSNRGLFVSLLEQDASAVGALLRAFQVRPVSQDAVVTFFRSLATLIRAGVSLARSLAICVEQCCDARLREALRGIADELRSGRALSDAMLSRPREFSPVAAASIKAGEQSGSLDEILMRLAAGLERERKLRKKLSVALTYPVIVLIACIGVSVLLLTTTVPIFNTMYEQLRVPIPPLLRILVWAGELLKNGAFILAVACMAAAAVIGVIPLRSNRRAASILESLQLGLPIVGPIAKRASAARISRLLGMLLSCGVSLHAALPILGEATQSPRFRASLEALQRAVFAGSALSPALESSGLYDMFFIQLVRAGEETGTVGEMLLRIAEQYEFDVEAALAQLGSALEPALIVVLGGVVGLIAAAIFIPLYSLIGSIK